MRAFAVATLVATSLFATNVFAGDLPLPPGRPAGIKNAQDSGRTVAYLAGGAAIIVGVVLLTTNNGNSHLAPGSTTTST